MTAPMSAAQCDALMPFAETEKQRQLLTLIKETGSIQKATVELGYDPAKSGHVRNMLSRIRAKASKQGYSPDHGWDHPVPDTHVAKGVSRYFRLDDGGIWVKADIKQEEREKLIQEALDAFKEKVPRAQKQAVSRGKKAEDLLNMYLITDYHLGMYAWHEESGDDWDLGIAEDLLIRWFQEAVQSAPATTQAVFAQLGDFLHFDGLEAVTPTNKHILDSDTRYQKIVRVAIRVLRRCVSMLLDKHDKVHIIMADANHDPSGSAWLREAFDAFYENEPRVTVDTSPDTFYAFKWGETALFWHHGHKVKPEKLPEVFAARFRDVYGATKHAYGHSGHFHHRVTVENALMPIEQHRTLAAKDAYAAGKGFMSGRDAPVVTYHKKYGEVGRVVISPEMVA